MHPTGSGSWPRAATSSAERAKRRLPRKVRRPPAPLLSSPPTQSRPSLGSPFLFSSASSSPLTPEWHAECDATAERIVPAPPRASTPTSAPTTPVVALRHAASEPQMRDAPTLLSSSPLLGAAFCPGTPTTPKQHLPSPPTTPGPITPRTPERKSAPAPREPPPAPKGARTYRFLSVRRRLAGELDEEDNDGVDGLCAATARVLSFGCDDDDDEERVRLGVRRGWYPPLAAGAV